MRPPNDLDEALLHLTELITSEMQATPQGDQPCFERYSVRPPAPPVRDGGFRYRSTHPAC